MATLYRRTPSHADALDSDEFEETSVLIEKTIDFHGYTLDEANKKISDLINNCFTQGVNKINIITGKGLRSKNKENPYISEDLSILKHSVPNFIKSKLSLMKIIKEISVANIEDGGQGAFYIFLKQKK